MIKKQMSKMHIWSNLNHIYIIYNQNIQIENFWDLHATVPRLCTSKNILGNIFKVEIF